MELDGSSCVSVFTQQWGHAPKTIGSAGSWNEAQQAGGFGTLLKNKPLPPKRSQKWDNLTPRYCWILALCPFEDLSDHASSSFIYLDGP